ncbi:MAG TPA: pyrimidine reductase family protein [Pseudolysinimonas sp.]|nr:pyrimidine reductase family protein [Pseudolysinimonas sp.]
MTARIDRIWPDPADSLSDEEIIGALGGGLRSGFGRELRVNFVESIDGAATVEGRSGGLSDAADKRRFELLRRVADAVIVGAGTVRAEGYGPLRVSAASARWRASHGMTEHPVLVVVSRELALDPASRIFTEAPVRPILITGAAVTAASRARFDGVADVIAVGRESVDLPAALAELRGRGLTGLLCEGGPSLFASLLEVDVVDELCVTIAPRLVAGDAVRIAHGATAPPRDMRLVEVLRSGGALLLRYRR